MDIDLIAAELRLRLEAWLDKADETTEGVRDLRDRLEALKGVLGTRATSDARDSLRNAERDA